jgi:hypothetical protein
MISIIELLTIDEQVRAPADIIYSTTPRLAEGTDGKTYYIKGPDPEIVFAEIAGCALAQEVGLPVASIAACRFEDSVYAGSLEVEKVTRDVCPWLNRPEKVSNFADLYSICVVDTWLANKDRNVGNVLGKAVRGSTIEFVFIDFEKARALRPTPTILSTMLPVRELWPSGDLGTAMQKSKPITGPQRTIDAIRSLQNARCEAIIDSVVEAVGADIGWAGDSLHAVTSRAGRIGQLVAELWGVI